GESSIEIVPYLATLMGMRVREPYDVRVRFLEPETVGRQIFQAVRRFIARLTEEAPVVLVFEDLHWIDGSSAQLLEHVLPLCNETRLLVVLSARTGEEQLRHFHAYVRAAEIPVREIELTPLTVLESRKLIEDFLGTSDSTDRIRDLILYKAQGNPFFLE